MVRAPKIDENGVKKGAWSEEEDNKLRNYIMQYGHWNWRELPKHAGLSRCGKSCRLRWVNYLRPNIKHGNYTKEEDDLIIKLHNELGNKWSAIAKELPGRSDNEIKNHWHTHLKKCAKRKRESSTDSEAPQIKVNQDQKKSTSEDSSGASNSSTESTSWSSHCAAFDYSITSSSPLSSNCSDFDWILEDSMASIDSLWTDPFLRDGDTTIIGDGYMVPLVTEYFSPPSPMVPEVPLWSYDEADGFMF